MTPEAMLDQAAAGAVVFEAAARDAVAHGGLTQPSGLPGWTQGYVVAHVARNADALVNLLTWARTGVPTPMYASPEARAAQIEADAQRPDGELLEDLTAAGARFARAAAAATGDHWLVPVQTALGKTVPAATVPWMRTRETWVHAVDLGGGVTLADVPRPVTELLLDDAVADFAGRADVPAVVLRATDTTRNWVLGATASDPSVEVTGATASLAAYVMGRPVPGPLEADGGRPVPELPAWL
ncbi:MAG TPA: maleylpyruvate isomerase family mycothiol-dependent enzyme [Streptosporangiaceae bacterium]|nr:maleylpyruvate isomerase family mycothiol-dependent enzyme [Streptosporangiaceae bacterium]